MAIEVRFESAATDGLRIIESIPALRPCRLEGRNGVGKTMAIRLLELAAGGQPYDSDPDGWKSFKKHIGSTVIDIQGLSVGTARLTLTPTAWDDEPGFGPGDKLGALELRGKTAPASSLFPLLDIVHLVGTEGLSHTLSNRNATYANVLRAVKASLDQMNAQRAQLPAIAATLNDVSPRAAAADREERVLLKKQIEDDESKLAAVSERLHAVKKAAGYQAMLSSADRPERSKKLAEATAKLPDAKKLSADLDAAVEAAVDQLDAGSKAQKAIAAEERKLTTLSKKRAKQLAPLPELALRSPVEGLDLLGPLSDADLATLTAAASAARETFHELDNAFQRAQMTDLQRTIHSQLRIVLEEGVRNGLADFPVLRLGEHAVTVGELAQGIYAAPPATTLESDDVRDAETRALDLEAMVAIHAAGPQHLLDLAAINANLTQLRADAPEQDELQSSLKSAREAQEKAEEEVHSLNRTIGYLQANSLPESEVEAAVSNVDVTLQSEGITSDELSARLDELAVEAANLRDDVEAAGRTLSEILERESRRELERRTLDPALNQDAPAAWLEAVGGGPLSAARDADDWWQGAADRAIHFDALVTSLVTVVAGLEYTAQNPTAVDVPFADALSSLVEEQALADLSAPAITEALFDNGVPESVNLKTKVIQWRTKDGQLREKPLSAFSSGESALGFMRARLRQIAEHDAKNRIVFLDEFGAFISADRQHPLVELLSSKQLRGLSDQIVIVLPLQADYSAQISETSGNLREQYQERAAQIEARGYFAEVFDQ